MDKISIDCPHCGKANMAPIIYGYPTPKLIDLARDEIIALGGTNYQELTHYCYSCNDTV